MLEYFIYFIFFIVGAVMGSFSNVVVFRLPLNIGLTMPNSKCFACGREIPSYDNIPIFAYLFLKGKCKYCGHKIDFRDFAVEIISALLYLLIAIEFYAVNSILTILLCASVSVLLIISCIDLDYQYIPQSLLIVLSIFSIIIAIIAPFGTFWEHILGAVVGGGFLLIIYGLGFLIKKREVIGIGDIKLMAVAGLILGAKGALFAYLSTFIITGIIILFKMIGNREQFKNTEIAFAPYLTSGIILSIFVGNDIINWYLSLFII